MKRCNACGLDKVDEEFRIRKGKPEGPCKQCNSAKAKEKYKKNREHILETLRVKRINDEAFRAKCNENSKKHGSLFRKNNPEYYKEYLQKIKGTVQYLKYLESSKEKKRQLEVTPEIKEKRRSLSISYRKSTVGSFSGTLRNNMAGALNSRLIKFLGFKAYSINPTKILNAIGARPSNDHSLDHIIPLASFDLRDVSQVGLAYSACNLRWLSNEENTSKGSLIIYSEIAKSTQLLEIAKSIGIREEHDGLDARAFCKINL